MELIVTTKYNLKQDKMVPSGRIHVIAYEEGAPWGRPSKAKSICGEPFVRNDTRSYTTDKAEMTQYAKDGDGGRVCKKCLKLAGRRVHEQG